MFKTMEPFNHSLLGNNQKLCVQYFHRIPLSFFLMSNIDIIVIQKKIWKCVLLDLRYPLRCYSHDVEWSGWENHMMFVQKPCGLPGWSVDIFWSWTWSWWVEADEVEVNLQWKKAFDLNSEAIQLLRNNRWVCHPQVYFKLD